MIDHIGDFITFLRANGIPPALSREIVADDRRRRFDIDGDKRNSKNGAYRLAVAGDFAYGWVRSHSMGKSFTYSSGRREEMTAEQRAAFARQLQDSRLEAQAARDKAKEDTALLAAMLWREGSAAVGAHEYALRKHIDLDGVKIGTGKAMGEILVPLYFGDRLWNLQRIDRKGGKRFLFGGRVEGCYHPIGRRAILRDRPYIYGEGWATGKTLRRVLECPTICTMNAGNIMAVAVAMRRKYIYARKIFAADFDCWTMRAEIRQEKFKDVDLKAIPGDDPDWKKWRAADWLVNPGMEKSIAAAKRVNGIVVTLPRDFLEHPAKPTDFNDMAQLTGDGAVRDLFKALL